MAYFLRVARRILVVLDRLSFGFSSYSGKLLTALRLYAQVSKKTEPPTFLRHCCS